MAVAASYVGVSKRTVQRWMRLGRKKGSGAFRDLRRAVQKAQAQAEMRDVLLIGKAGQKHWQAAAWRLERRYPERWGRSNRDKAIESRKSLSPEAYSAAVAGALAAMEATVPHGPTTQTEATS